MIAKILKLHQSSHGVTIPSAHLEHIGEAVDLASAKMVMMVAATSAAIPAVTSAMPSGQFYDDWRMVSACLVGSTMGAFFSIACFPIDTGSRLLQKLSIKFGVSMLSGVSFTPFVIENAGTIWDGLSFIHPTIANIIAVSSSIAFLFVWAIHVLLPYVEQKISSMKKKR